MHKLLLAAAVIVGSGPAAGPATTSPGPASSSVSTQVVRTAQTLSGQALRLPQGKAEMVAGTVEIPAGGHTTIHQHPWSRFVYVERGPLKIVNEDTRQVDVLQTGQVFAEVVAQWHQGHALGPEGARVVVIDVVPPGESNMKMR
ncbi:MAG TPA: cupin domain-containing protein [Sphingomicrobium sp.]|nr:cupin domain-containing protein [Sphingomicrobium sp.]